MTRTPSGVTECSCEPATEAVAEGVDGGPESASVTCVPGAAASVTSLLEPDKPPVPTGSLARWRSLLGEDLNFLLTNRVPRLLLTRFMGWFSQIENPAICTLSMGVWRLFADLDLSDARKRRFSSLHECFTRELRPGTRPIDDTPGVLTSPCDGIVGASGSVCGTTIFQAKGFPYTLESLFGDPELVERYRNGCYVTLRLTSSMYHRFHAPHDCRVEEVNYISGDTWNVNPIALKRVERLFCKNERALIRTRLERGGHELLLVPVAAILVASIRLHFLDVLLHMKYRGPNRLPCDARFHKGQEMGWFQHGSTILVFAPESFTLHPSLRFGQTIRMGQPLLSLPQALPG